MTTDTIGGVWTLTQELGGELLRRGCAVRLVSLGRRPSAAQRDWCEGMSSVWGDRFRYDALEIPLEWMQENAAAYEQAAPALARMAAEFDADVLHSHQFCFGALPVEIPRVVTAHSDVFSWWRACRGGEPEPSPWLERYTAMVGRGLVEADAVVAPTRWMAESLTRDFVLPCDPRVIWNGVEMAGGSTSPRKLQAVTAGRLWDEGKNIALLGECEWPLPVLVAGETAHGDAAAPRSLGTARLLGALDGDAVRALFRESAIYLCTSRYEPFGLAPLEAALCGCAVVASDIPSLREVWEAGALYFQDAASLRRLLQRLCDDPAKLRAAQQRSLLRARGFTAEKMARAYLHLFEQVTMRRQEAA